MTNRYLNRKTTILATLMLLFGLLFSTSAQAFQFPFLDFFKDKPAKKQVVNRAAKNPSATQVEVGLYLLHIGKFDLQSASYEADFYLIFKCQPVCKNIYFEIMNATTFTSELAAQQNGILVYRVHAALTKGDSLRNYPFDNHTIEIIIENRQLTKDKMIFVSDPETTAVDENLNVAGFHLDPKWRTSISDHYYSVFQENYSSYKFSLTATRPWLAGLLKGILPALIIIWCSFLALFIKIDHVSQRLGVATSTLIAAMVFHLNLTSSLPPLGYITFADMFMFLNYLYLLIVLIEVVVIMFYIDTQHHTRAARINKLCARIIPLMWIITQFIAWIAFNPARQ